MGASRTYLKSLMTRLTNNFNGEEKMREIKCEGSCEEHKGDVKRVHVWYGSKDWGEFDYCDQAIEEDERRGMQIELVK